MDQGGSGINSKICCVCCATLQFSLTFPSPVLGRRLSGVFVLNNSVSRASWIIKLPTDTDRKCLLLIWVEYLCSEDTDGQKNPVMSSKVAFSQGQIYFFSFCPALNGHQNHKFLKSLISQFFLIFKTWNPLSCGVSEGKGKKSICGNHILSMAWTLILCNHKLQHIK